MQILVLTMRISLTLNLVGSLAFFEAFDGIVVINESMARFPLFPNHFRRTEYVHLNPAVKLSCSQIT